MDIVMLRSVGSMTIELDAVTGKPFSISSRKKELKEGVDYVLENLDESGVYVAQKNVPGKQKFS